MTTMTREIAICALMMTAVVLSFLGTKSIASGTSTQNSQPGVYSAFDSASWAITSDVLSPMLGADKQLLYDDFIKKCDVATAKGDGVCSRNDNFRHRMNREQPGSVYNFTKHGYAKMKVPTDLYDLIKEHFDKYRDLAEIEWKEYNVYHNMWESPPTIIDINNESSGGSLSLTSVIEEKVKPILEEWTGQKLSPVSTYGIRMYHNGSILAPHVDRMPLITSVIIQVDQDIDVPWPLEVYGHDGVATNVTMEPGDMVLYESHSVIHGRPFPMVGNFFANCFIHFEPYEPIEGESSYDPKSGVPPYVVPGSVWEAEWKKQNPDGWKGRELTVPLAKFRAAAGQGNSLLFKSMMKLYPEMIDNADDNGWTVLHEAARGGSVEIVKLILEQGVDKDLLTKAGISPLNIALEHHELVKYFESIGAKNIYRHEEL
mmetsp:Transcript_20213/g.47339  ORF Transcript_20213/g.47339 Transcript_20213/m.47339 type:complete len:429 (-) Transcript_20213:1610-2896(-)